MDHEDAHWFKSSHSGGSGTECVEIAKLPDGAAVRDSKAPGRPGLTFHRVAWADFVDSLLQYSRF